MVVCVLLSEGWRGAVAVWLFCMVPVRYLADLKLKSFALSFQVQGRMSWGDLVSDGDKGTVQTN